MVLWNVSIEGEILIQIGQRIPSNYGHIFFLCKHAKFNNSELYDLSLNMHNFPHVKIDVTFGLDLLTLNAAESNS